MSHLKVSSATVREKVNLIVSNRDKYSISAMFEFLGISRNLVYYHLNKKDNFEKKVCLMKKIIGLIVSVMLCTLCIIPAFAVSSNEDPMHVSKKIINEIQSDIASEEIDSWTELANSSMDFKYVVPVYSTLGVNEDSSSLRDTLVFTGEYNIPVIADNECVGTFNVVKHKGKWTVNSYTVDLDLKTAVEQRLNSSWMFIEIPQLGDDFGFVMFEGNSENYQSISSGQSTLSSENTDDILQQIKDYDIGEKSEEVASMEKTSNSNFSLVLLIAIIFCASVATVYVLRKQKKTAS